MKYLYPLSLALLLLTSCAKEEKKVIDRENTDWAFYKLNGDVKSINEKSFESPDGKTKGETKHELLSDHDRKLTFNDEGMLVSEKAFNPGGQPFEEITYKGRELKESHTQFINGSPSLKAIYVYDKTGKNPISITRRNPDNTQFDKIVMKYKGGKLIEKTTYNSQDNPNNKVEYIYDQHGLVKGENNYLSTDVIEYKTAFTYNDKKQKTEEVHYNKEGKVDYITKYAYDGDKLVSTETYDGKGELTYSERSSFDEKGNLIKHVTFDKFDNSQTLDEYVYDTKGNRTGWNVTKGKDLQVKANYTYDNHGNMTKSMVTDAEGKVLESKLYTYKYDKKGNWVQKTFKTEGRAPIITERKITYFENEE